MGSASTAATTSAPDRPAVTASAASSPATNQPRRLAINFLFLSGGEFGAKILTFLSFTYLARTLGPANYGFLEFTLAVMVFFTVPVDLGLGSYGAREIARNPGRAAQLLQEITGLRMTLTLCSMAGLGLFILFLHKSAELKILLAIYGVSLLASPFLLQWFFQAHDQMHWVGAASIVRQTGFAGLIFLTYRRGFPLFYLGLIECASVAAVTAFCIYVTRSKMGFAWPWPVFRLRQLTYHLREASPIGLTELAWSFMWYFSTVLLGFVFSDRTLGWFGASHRTLMALNTFVWLYFFNLLPSISRCVTKPHTDLLALMDQSVRFASWAGLFTAAFLTAAAPTVLTLIYGPSFKPAAPSFAILVWMLPVAMLSGHHRYILIAYNRQKLLLLCTVISAVAAVVLGFALVPLYRGQGAAWALLIAIVINFALVYFCVRWWVVEVPVLQQLSAPLITLAVSTVVYAALAGWNGWVAITCGSLVYAAGVGWFSGRQLASFVRTIAGR